MCNECMQIKYILMQQLIFQIIFYNFPYIKTHMKTANLKVMSQNENMYQPR